MGLFAIGLTPREENYQASLSDVVDLIEALASAVVRYGVQEYTHT